MNYISVTHVRPSLFFHRSYSNGWIPLACMLFNGGPVVEYLKTVKEFLDSHPTEVITFVFTNPEKLSIEEYWKPAFDKSGTSPIYPLRTAINWRWMGSGITPLVYIPPHAPMKRDDWPTLGEMIKSDKRVVTFIDLGTTTEVTGKPFVDFILPQFKMVRRTSLTLLLRPSFASLTTDDIGMGRPLLPNRLPIPLQNRQTRRSLTTPRPTKHDQS